MPLFRRAVSLSEAVSVVRAALAANPAVPLPEDLLELSASLRRRDPLPTAPGPVRESGLLEAFPEPAGLLEEGGRFAASNTAMDTLLAGRTVGRTVLQATRCVELSESAARAFRDGSQQCEPTLPGLGKAVHATISPLSMGGALLVLRDLTAQKRAETVRRDFIANASHELRTPVAAITGAAETLLEMHVDDGPRSFIEMIARQGARLARLTSDLLDLSKLEAGQWPVEAGVFDVLPICEAAIELVRERALAKEIHLGADVAAELRFRADPRAMEQILVNLLDNAIKHTPQGGRVTLLGDWAGTQVMVSVLDTGPGIEPRHQQRIFERFYRADNGRARSDGGSGLGLAIVKHLAQAQGGDVGVESGRGGSRFWVRLPGTDSMPSCHNTVTHDA
jgi:two-component system phosphate regulon sensor histidine kinase PhoR